MSGFHVKVCDLATTGRHPDSLYHLDTPTAEGKGDYVLTVDTKIANLLLYGSLAAGTVVALVGAPGTFIVMCLGGYIFSDALQPLNDVVDKIFKGPHCDDKECAMMPVLAAMGTATVVYLFPMLSWPMAAVLGQSLGSYAKKHIEIKAGAPDPKPAPAPAPVREAPPADLG